MAEQDISKDSETKPATGMMAALEGFGGLSLIRQVGVMVGLAASIALGFGVVLWSQEPSFRPLYTDISHLEAGQVADLLQREKIAFKIDTNSGMLLVENGRIHDARLMLAQEGFPTGQAMGYELLDKEQGFGTSQFMEQARYLRSLEGEMARTISSMNKVRRARVHLAIPKRTVFVNDRRKPSASVMVELFPGQSLEQMQVASIVHLVASSIPEMNEQDVTVVDQRGNLLSEKDKDSDIALAARQFEYTHTLEEAYIRRIEGLLQPLVGAEGFRVQLSADVDFSVTQQTAESFNPDLPAVRSEQTLNEFMGPDGMVAGIPGALSNQPPGAGNAPETTGANGENVPENANVRRQATRNYELDRTISHTRHQVGNIRRLSVAVVVDDKWAFETNAEGERTRVKKPLSDAELERITVLVQDAIGFSAARGDSVTVINEPFQELVEEVVGPDPEWWKEDWVMELTRNLGGIMVALFVLLVLRSMLKKLMETGTDEYAGLEAAMAGGDLGLDLGAGTDGLDVRLTGSSNPLLPGPDTSFDQQVDAVKTLVAEDPKRVAQVVKTWLESE